MKQSRYPELKRASDGKCVCRGCGGTVPPNRQTWCSKECYQQHCPQAAAETVRLRDREVCQKCGWDYQSELKKWNSREAEFQCRQEWRMQKPTKPEYHHIIPFSEGGSHSADNIMTLCHECHAAETRAWRRSKIPDAGKQISERELAQGVLDLNLTPAAKRDIFEK